MAKRDDPFGFEKAINMKALDDMTPEQLEWLADVLKNVPGGKKKKGRS